MIINFLKYTITIYPQYDKSLVRKKKLSENKKKKYSHTFRHTNNQLD